MTTFQQLLEHTSPYPPVRGGVKHDRPLRTKAEQRQTRVFDGLCVGVGFITIDYPRHTGQGADLAPWLAAQRERGAVDRASVQPRSQRGLKGLLRRLKDGARW